MLNDFLVHVGCFVHVHTSLQNQISLLEPGRRFNSPDSLRVVLVILRQKRRVLSIAGSYQRRRLFARPRNCGQYTLSVGAVQIGGPNTEQNTLYPFSLIHFLFSSLSMDSLSKFVICDYQLVSKEATSRGWGNYLRHLVACHLIDWIL